MPKSNPQTMQEWLQRQQQTQNRQGLRARGIGPLRYGTVTTAGATPVVTMADDSSMVTVGAWPSSYSPVVDDVVLVAPFKPSQGQVAILEKANLAGGASTSLLPYAMASGLVTIPTGVAGSGGSGSATVTFPSGRFSIAPIVIASAGNGRLTMAPVGISTTGFSLTWNNWSTAATGAAAPGFWTATQMTAASASG